MKENGKDVLLTFETSGERREEDGGGERSGERREKERKREGT